MEQFFGACFVFCLVRQVNRNDGDWRDTISLGKVKPFWKKEPINETKPRKRFER